MFRDASRIAQILAASGDSPEHHAAVQEAMASFDQAATLRLCEVELDRLAEGLRAEVNAAYGALRERDSKSIIASAHALHEAASLQDIPAAGARAALGPSTCPCTLPRPRAAYRVW